MLDIVFLSALSIVSLMFLLIGFTVLPKEKWQIIGTLPIRKVEGDIWKGVTLTYYGLFNAIACAFSVMLLFILLGAVNFSPLMILSIVCGLVVVLHTPSQAFWQSGWRKKKTH